MAKYMLQRYKDIQGHAGELWGLRSLAAGYLYGREKIRTTEPDKSAQILNRKPSLLLKLETLDPSKTTQRRLQRVP